ncbi:hypothetical protein C1645_838548 [Glomus cerebriforme]|uniref:Uncharacterized protein n=1 Tax=Glomus cerebriforme TaxID=658196 RepID=A0A397S895_9GLOM|nr:hypothetical protein C1645_838548 [Glomus cerebriforme]
MPKTSLNKLKNHERVTSFINFNINENLSDETNHKPSFPPNLTINDLIKNANINNKPKMIPNAFIIYRMALMKEYRIKNRKMLPMSEISKIAKNSWIAESKHVKDFYKSLVKNAKSIYKQNNIQIVLDKNMNYMNYEKNNQKGYDVERQREVKNEKFQNQNSAENSDHINNFSSPDVSSANISMVNSSPNYNGLPYEVNSAFNDREYIKVLEETILYLARK